MAKHTENTVPTNVRLHAPIWRWRRVPSPASPVSRHSRPQDVISAPFPGYRGMRHPLPAVIEYQGGPEGYVIIHARGWRFKFPGQVPLLEVVQCLNGQMPPAE